MEVLKLVIGLALVAAGIAGLVFTTRRHRQAVSDSRDVARWVISIGGTVVGLWLFIHGLVNLLRLHVHGS